MKNSYFFMSSKNIERDSFIWNMSGSMIMAFQSVILLMILTRTVGLINAGIFTIAFANANLFMNIGKYGMRNFQVSDVKRQFSFKEYLDSRWVTTGAMFLVSVVYVVVASISKDYSFEKAMVIFWMCLFKIPDVIEDVYFGDYQKKGRLDVGSKAITIRMVITLFLFGGILIIWKDLLLALVISTIVTFIIMIIFIKMTITNFTESCKRSWKNVLLLLKQCFPLAAGAFLSFYIGNAPKYAIDSLLSDQLQACYGFIAMPVFVIGLLNSFIFNPMLYKISKLWNEKKVKDFLMNVGLQVALVFGITFVCIIGAYLIGIPVLSWLYNTELAPYKKELLILLLGGGFLGLSGLLCAVITIIRCQNAVLGAYGIIAVFAYLLSNLIVSKYAMMGAAVLYTLLMGLLCLAFFGIFIFGVMKNK